jgi:DNA-binding winged helix-turn-helix (wHTH) protein
VSTYRMYFRTSGKIFGREDLKADDDAAAIRIARVLYDTYSAVSDCLELWQGTRRIFDWPQSHHQKVCLADLIEAHQGVVLDKEETIGKSRWMIARSRRLIEAVDRVKSPVDALGRNANPGSEPAPVHSVIRTGRLVVYLNAQLATVDRRPLHLTNKEYAVLELLSLRKGTIVTREMLLARLYGGRDEPRVKIIDIFVCTLRRKIAEANGGDHHIETVWGRGYVLIDPNWGNRDLFIARFSRAMVKRAGHRAHVPT